MREQIFFQTAQYKIFLCFLKYNSEVEFQHWCSQTDGNFLIRNQMIWWKYFYPNPVISREIIARMRPIVRDGFDRFFKKRWPKIQVKKMQKRPENETSCFCVTPAWPLSLAVACHLLVLWHVAASSFVSVLQSEMQTLSLHWEDTMIYKFTAYQLFQPGSPCRALGTSCALSSVPVRGDRSFCVQNVHARK